ARSFDGDVVDLHNESDMWVVQLAPTGIMGWQGCLGRGGFEEAYSISTTLDGLVVAGYTFSNDGDASGQHNTETSDAWVVKLSATGAVGKEASNEPKLLLSPNPANGIISVHYTLEKSEDVNVEVFNALGQQV